MFLVSIAGKKKSDEIKWKEASFGFSYVLNWVFPYATMADVDSMMKRKRQEDDRKRREEVAASLLMLSETAVFSPATTMAASKTTPCFLPNQPQQQFNSMPPGSTIAFPLQNGQLQQFITTNHQNQQQKVQFVTTSNQQPSITLAGMVPRTTTLSNGQILPIVTNANSFSTFRTSNGQLTKIVAVHRIETASALPYNQLIKVVKDLPNLMPVDHHHQNGGAVIKSENGLSNGGSSNGLPRIVLCNQPGGSQNGANGSNATFMKLPTVQPLPSTSSGISYQDSSCFSSQPSTSGMSKSSSNGAVGGGMGYYRPSTSSGCPSSGGNSSCSSQDDINDNLSDSSANGKRGRKVKYPRTEGDYNPVKEFRNRQRKQQNEEDEKLAVLEEQYKKSNSSCHVTLEELYFKHQLVELVPERTEKRIKRKEAENVEEKKMRKRLQARRDSKNYREREKRRREFITKRVKLLEHMMNRKPFSHAQNSMSTLSRFDSGASTSKASAAAGSASSSGHSWPLAKRLKLATVSGGAQVNCLPAACSSNSSACSSIGSSSFSSSIGSIPTHGTSLGTIKPSQLPQQFKQELA